ncbi:FAD-dependent oxidoreductase [Jongsikchunia kroppenstedtii]|uniref:FAD-dependent oxidoreductase n=1 Tax=Jongsikchunia kroppenstedtii TaxID=1121721 RepID=UPI0009D9C633|nr:FAD-dependent oxidoreductase [Jongsikchunia kroppenstedtii]
MPHVVTQSCCSDASCVYACPVNCIHPTPDEPDFLTAEMLHIDPYACVDCGACVRACPVGAIVPDRKLNAKQSRFLEINHDFYDGTDRSGSTVTGASGRSILAKPIPLTPITKVDEDLRVAVIGSGPAAMYTAEDLIKRPGVQVTIFERLPDPYGLARRGVAPDHQTTRQVTELFDLVAANPRVKLLTGVEVGKDVTIDELQQQFHAVVYAVGASTDKKLDVPGAETVTSATEFVAWYNGHPDYADRTFDLSGERVVIVGNGNVALDVARILAVDPAKLTETDIAPYALQALRDSKIREIDIVARRGPAQAAFTVPEFVGLVDRPDITLAVDPAELVIDPETAALEASGDLPHATKFKLQMLREVAARGDAGASDDRLIRLRFMRAPSAIGDGAITLVRNEFQTDADGRTRVVATDDVETVPESLVLTSVGYHGRPVSGLPFDDRRGVIPNAAGRVDGMAGVYVAGWIKRGPTGFIGTNKSDAQETVRLLLDDFNAGRLASPARTAAPTESRLR